MRILKNLCLRSLLPIVIILFVSLQVDAQRRAGAVGIGGQFGDPTGLTIKIYKPYGISTDILAAWDLNDFFYLNVHGLYERHIDRSEVLHFFVGPGLFVGLKDRNGASDGFGDNALAAGLSGSLGLNVVIGRVELYGQVTPRLELIDKTATDVGGGVGIRFYLR